MTSSRIINNLNDQGLHYNRPAVRDRKLYKTAYRMLRYQNFETNSNATSLMKIKAAFSAIKANMVSDDMHYVPQVDTVVLNEMRQVETEVKWNELVHRFYRYEDHYTHSTKEMKTYKNLEKLKHINHVKAVNGKAKKKLARKLADLEKEKWKYDFFSANELPELRALLHDPKKFADAATIAASRRHFAMVADKMTPWATDEISDKLSALEDYQADDKWGELKRLLISRPSYEQKKEEIQKGHLEEYDPKIMAEPDEFVEEIEVKHYDKKPTYFKKERIYKDKITEIKPFNHMGIRETPEAFENIAEEIYKISEMPGFGPLKLHWSGVRARNKALQKELSKVRDQLSQKAKSYHMPGRKSRKGRKKNPKPPKKSILKDVAESELRQFKEICEEYDLLNKEAESMTKEEYLTEIKKDLIKISKVSPKVNNIAVFTRYEGFVGKTDIPTYALKRYQAILRSASLNENVYTSLRYHFSKREKYIKSRRYHRTDYNYGYCDY
jgi:hypothetical protein